MRRTLRILGRIVVRLSLLAMLLGAGWWVVMDPDSPLSAAWNPMEPLDVAAPRTWLTGTKLRRAVMSDAGCLAALATGAEFVSMEPLAIGECGIDPRVSLSRVGEVSLAPVETTCAVALRTAMWERHSLRAAAEELGSPIVGLRHQGSYNCRPIRGGNARLSTHATASALDVRGVELADGRRLELRSGWDHDGQGGDQSGGEGGGADGAFWRAARDGACDWFVTVLGPEYNALHADHFHMQSTGWGLCR